jgi:hypothetical protein
MHGKRVVVEREARQPRIHDALAHIGLGDRGEPRAGRALEVRVLRNLYRRVRAAQQIAARRTGIRRIGTRGDITRSSLLSRGNVCERRDPDDGDDSKQPVKLLWPI